MNAVIEWLANSTEPWTRYRTLVDLLELPETEPDVIKARQEMLSHPDVRGLIETAATWGETTLKRHNDASHPIYAISTLADFGVRTTDPNMKLVADKILAHQSPEGPFQTVINIPKAFGGDSTDHWTWIICDAPTLLYCLIAFGLENDPRVRLATDHLVSLLDENGWRCRCAPELGRFRGPGKKDDPCPIANVYALKALSIASYQDGPAVHIGTEMLLSHWAGEIGPKMYLFGVGSDYRKLKYPFVWYDILHVADVLSHYPFIYSDVRFQNMIDVITQQADQDGRYTATSMYKAWKSSPSGGWSFADKKSPSPWITFLVLRLQKRAGILV